MPERHYFICRNNNNNNKIIYIDYDKLSGFNFEPQNNVKYDGIKVNKMMVIKPSMVEKVLKRKIKRKLDLYLKLMIKYIEEDDGTNDGILSEALNDLTRYKEIIAYKYRKYLDTKYLNALFKKIAILEYELNSRIELNNQYYDYEEKTSHRSR